MNFNIINNLLFLFLFIPLLSCKNFEKENIYINEDNKDKREIVDQIIIDSDLNNNQLYEDFYSNAFSVDFLKNEKLSKKFTINNFKNKYDGLNPIKVIKFENFLYSIDSKAKFSIFDIEDGKLVNKINLFNNKNKNLIIPTSFSRYKDKFIIGFKSGIIILINNQGEIIWETDFKKILSTPIAINENDIIFLLEDSINSISINDGLLNWSEVYEGSNLLQYSGGLLKIFNNIIYYILPNSSFGEYDLLFRSKNLSNFSDMNFKSSINYSNSKIHLFDNYLVYFDGSNSLSTYDIFDDKIILSDFNVENLSSFYFYNNTLITIKNNKLKSYNILNGNLFWNINIEEKLYKKAKIINIFGYDQNIYIFFDNGKIIMINQNNIINKFDLKIKNINLLYFQNNQLFASLENGKTVLY